MTRPRLHLIHSTQLSQASTQTGCSKEFRVIEGGRRHRRRSDAEVMKADMAVLWQRFVQLVFGYGPGARSETAVEFGATLQTACNWHDGVVAPMGHAVAHAARAFPEEFDAIFRADRARRAA
jgi:hypothetical protein